jgi:hypothetical protein
MEKSRAAHETSLHIVRPSSFPIRETGSYLAEKLRPPNWAELAPVSSAPQACPALKKLSTDSSFAKAEWPAAKSMEGFMSRVSQFLMFVILIGGNAVAQNLEARNSVNTVDDKTVSSAGYAMTPVTPAAVPATPQPQKGKSPTRSSSWS